MCAQPQAEDAPNTRTNLAASSFFLTPLNYFDADVSMDSLNAIILTSPPAPGARRACSNSRSQTT